MGSTLCTDHGSVLKMTQVPNFGEMEMAGRSSPTAVEAELPAVALLPVRVEIDEDVDAAAQRGGRVKREVGVWDLLAALAPPLEASPVQVGIGQQVREAAQGTEGA